MAKIAFTKLSLSKNTLVKEVEWKDQKIEVKQYLPVGDKLDLISRIVNYAADEHVFYNPCKVEIFELIEVILAYTNINVTDKQKEDPCKLFDLLHSSGLAEQIYMKIPENELGAIQSIVEATIHNIYEYKNSALGILQAMSDDYDSLNLDATNIQEKLANKENVEFLQQVITKLG
jgi:hypothetical protein